MGHSWPEITHLYLFVPILFLNKVGLSQKSRFLICPFSYFCLRLVRCVVCVVLIWRFDFRRLVCGVFLCVGDSIDKAKSIR